MKKAIKDAELTQAVYSFLKGLAILEGYAVDVVFSSKILPLIQAKTIDIVPISAIKDRIAEQVLNVKETTYEIYIFQETINIDREGILNFQLLVQDIEQSLEGEDYENTVVDSHIDKIEWDAKSTPEQGFVFGACLTYLVSVSGVK